MVDIIGSDFLLFFFFKQKTAYEMRISDWSSDVCSSDLIAFVVIAVLQKFGVQTASLVAALGAGALAIGLALQGALGNVASGIIIAFMRPYRIGDFVEINGLDGEVTDLDLFFTQIQTLDDKRVFVPNSQAVSNPIVNFSREGVRRCITPFGIGYDAIGRAHV